MHMFFYAYKVSLPCIVWCASFRGEEVVIFKSVLRLFFVDGHHGNTKKYMRTKFHLYALYGEQV